MLICLDVEPLSALSARLTRIDEGFGLAACGVVRCDAAGNGATSCQNVLTGSAAKLIADSATKHRARNSCASTADLLFLLRGGRATLQNSDSRKDGQNSASFHRSCPFFDFWITYNPWLFDLAGGGLSVKNYPIHDAR